MRFQKFINERRRNVDLTDDDTWIELKETLKKKCLPVIKDLYKDRNKLEILPYSGRKFKLDDWTIKDVRKNRQPKDMPREIHNFIDDYFDDKYGYRFRSNSIFLTGKINQANTYGIAYIVLPVGNYEILWSSISNDLYSELLEKDHNIHDAIWSIVGSENQKSDETLELEWEDLYGVGGNGRWSFYEWYSAENDEEDAAEEIFQDIGFDINMTEEKEDIQDVYKNFNKYIKKIDIQKNLFDDETKISHLKYENQIWAEQYENRGKYYIKNEDYDIIEGKHKQSVFDNSEDSWNAYKYYMIKDAIENEIAIDRDILKDFMGERWAEEILGFFRKSNKNYNNLFDLILESMEWEPDVTLGDFLDEYSEYVDEESTEDVYEILDSYQTGDFVDAINIKNEIMLNSKEYIVINTYYEDAIIDWIKSGEWRK